LVVVRGAANRFAGSREFPFSHTWQGCCRARQWYAAPVG
jgi:hypothetical protein